MDEYINKFHSFQQIYVYDFKIGDGGTGDCIKFFMYILEICIANNIRLYYKKNNIELEKYIKLKYNMMYIDEDTLKTLNDYTIVKSCSNGYWSLSIHHQYIMPFQNVFYFTEEVIKNSKNLLPSDITNYISIHLRLGDKFLETDKEYVQCLQDARYYVEEEIYKYIEDNNDKNIFFCSDNKDYKLRLKEKYNNIIITNCDIGHTSFYNTTQKQVLDGISELYILSNSVSIYMGSFSSFSLVASNFKNTPLLSFKERICF